MSGANASYKIGRVDELDGLRGLMALWVACTHILCWCGLAYIKTPWPISHMWPEFIAAQPAVHTFIILSGFAISFLIHHRPQPYTSFIVGRLFRLYPVYLACLLVGIVTVPFTPFIVKSAPWHDDPFYERLAAQVATVDPFHYISHIFWHLTMLHGAVPRNVLPGVCTSVLPPAWSISLEWQYYLMAFAIARFLHSGWGILCMAGATFLSLRHVEAFANPNLAFLPCFLPLFLLGIVSYHLYDWFCSVGAKRSDAYQLPISGLTVVAVALSSWSLAVVIWAVAFGSIFVEGNGRLTRALCSLRRFLTHPVLQWLGAISYPLYLIHWPIIVALMALLLRCKPVVTSMEALCWLTLVGLPFMLGSAYVLHRTIEVRFMRLGKELGRRNRGVSLGPARGWGFRTEKE